MVGVEGEPVGPGDGPQHVVHQVRVCNGVDVWMVEVPVRLVDHADLLHDPLGPRVGWNRERHDLVEPEVQEGRRQRVRRSLGRIAVAPVLGGQAPADLDRTRDEPVAAGQAGEPDERRRPGGRGPGQLDGPEPEPVTVLALADLVQE